jgi:hypothetical protein
MRGRAAFFFCASLTLLLGFTLVPGCTGDADGDSGEGPPVVRLQEGEYLYLYHVITGTESLYHLPRDPRRLKNLAAERPELAMSLRRTLERKIGVSDLSELRDENGRSLNALRGLGYL